MHIPDRVYGMENEFGVVIENERGAWEEIRMGIVQRLCNDVLCAGLIRSVPSTRLWHVNGGCTYVDIGEHPEHATPECRLVREAVLYCKAGEIIAASVFCGRQEDNSRMILFKNNLGCDENGNVVGEYGSHENYLYRILDLKQKSVIEQLIPFLITRQIIDGAGWQRKDGKFLFSQRSVSMAVESGTNTTNNRSIVNLRNTVSDTGTVGRLHLIQGDANILDVACFLKIGTTSLVLSLIEAGLAPHMSYGPCAVVMKEIAEEPDINVPQGIYIQERRMSPFEVQCVYLEAARKAFAGAEFDSEDTEAEMKTVLNLWDKALNALYSRDERWMIGRLDYPTKRFLADEAIKRRGITDRSKMMDMRKDMDIFYHNITDRRLQEAINRRWMDRRLITDKQIEKAIFFPPPHTRARLRGKFIGSVLNLPETASISIDWMYCGHINIPSAAGNYVMDDPLIYASSEFNTFLMEFLNRPPIAPKIIHQLSSSEA